MLIELMTKELLVAKQVVEKHVLCTKVRAEETWFPFLYERKCLHSSYEMLIVLVDAAQSVKTIVLRTMKHEHAIRGAISVSDTCRTQSRAWHASDTVNLCPTWVNHVLADSISTTDRPRRFHLQHRSTSPTPSPPLRDLADFISIDRS